VARTGGTNGVSTKREMSPVVTLSVNKSSNDLLVINSLKIVIWPTYV
jgi:hypothetical protein